MSWTVPPSVVITVIIHVHIVIAREFNIVRQGIVSTPVPDSIMRLENSSKEGTYFVL